MEMAMCTSHHTTTPRSVAQIEMISKTNEQVSKHHNHYDSMITESYSKNGTIQPSNKRTHNTMPDLSGPAIF